jgi:Bacterial protein of unknown function (DUF853)
VEFYALGGLGAGVPVRATITSFGPTLLSRVLGLNDIQESSLGLVFMFADQNGLPLLDLKDLRSVIFGGQRQVRRCHRKGVGLRDAGRARCPGSAARRLRRAGNARGAGAGRATGDISAGGACARLGVPK